MLCIMFPIVPIFHFKFQTSRICVYFLNIKKYFSTSQGYFAYFDFILSADVRLLFQITFLVTYVTTFPIIFIKMQDIYPLIKEAFIRYFPKV